MDHRNGDRGKCVSIESGEAERRGRKSARRIINVDFSKIPFASVVDEKAIVTCEVTRR